MRHFLPYFSFKCFWLQINLCCRFMTVFTLLFVVTTQMLRWEMGGVRIMKLEYLDLENICIISKSGKMLFSEQRKFKVKISPMSMIDFSLDTGPGQKRADYKTFPFVWQYICEGDIAANIGQLPGIYKLEGRSVLLRFISYHWVKFQHLTYSHLQPKVYSCCSEYSIK